MEGTFQTGAGLLINETAADKRGFHGAAPVAQRAGSAQAAVTATTIPNAAGDAPDDDEFDAVVARVNALTALANELRAALVEKGIIKGAA
jgi:hypothetical protein